VAMIVTAESELGKELAKWNVQRPPTYFPRMMYMARRRPDGVVSVGEVEDAIFARPGQQPPPGAAESWSAGCQIIVNDEAEQAKALERGWRYTPAEAMTRFEEKERAIGEAAAVRAYEDRNMSDAAKAEIAEADAETEEHLAEVPEKKKRGRPAKQH
jgi:hypothetical protein